MNQNGKEQMAKKIALAVKSMLQKKKSDPIVLFEKGHVDALAVVSKTKTIPKHDTAEPSNTQTTTSYNDTSAIRSSTRPKRPPNTMLKDFLW